MFFFFFFSTDFTESFLSLSSIAFLFSGCFFFFSTDFTDYMLVGLLVEGVSDI